ncbi:hypothetical protein [Sphingomonas sp. PB4P5]|uniref:hypothetical protein n=1 Tax=Parasphingomonas puruogangriensis TaxID=3096155 RepID=UPI002FC71DE2
MNGSLRDWLGLCNHKWEQTGTIETKRGVFRRSAPEKMIRVNVIGISVMLECERCGMVKTRKLA